MSEELLSKLVAGWACRWAAEDQGSRFRWARGSVHSLAVELEFAPASGSVSWLAWGSALA